MNIERYFSGPLEFGCSSNTKYIHIERRLHYGSQLRLNTYESSKNIKLADMNLAQMSFAYYSRRIRESALTHDSIKYFHSLFELYYEFTLSLITLIHYNPYSEENEWIELSLDQMETLWQALVTSNLDLLVLCVTKLAKVLAVPLKNLPSGDDMKKVIEQLSISLELSKIKSCSFLWKSGSIVTLRRFELWTIGDEMDLINNAVDYWGMNPAYWFQQMNESDFLTVKTSVLEATSTLYFLNDQEIIDTELFRSVQDVPEKLKLLSVVKPIPHNLNSIQAAQSQMTKIMLWPIHDTQILRAEMNTILELFDLLNGITVILSLT